MRDMSVFATRGLTLMWSNTCTVKRSVGDASAYPTPSTVHTSLKCTQVYEVSEEEKEKGWLTSISRPLKVYTEVPDSGNIREHDIVVINSLNYTVVKANRWPHSDPRFYELIVEHKRGQ